MPSPGAGAQTTGPAGPPSVPAVWEARRPTQGRRSSPLNFIAEFFQRGFPAPQNRAQARPAETMPQRPPVWGGVYQHYTPYYDRGAAAFVPNFGYVLTNPIGAGIVARYRPQASYGLSAQFLNGALWWTNQIIPTSIHMQGLTSPEELAAIVDGLTVEAMVRTTG